MHTWTRTTLTTASPSKNVNPNLLNMETTSTSPTSKSTRPIMTNTIACRSCPVCAKKFRSWKALFGHMRCHPERQWRGINPPPNYRPPEPTSTEEATAKDSSTVTEEDHEVATCLLMLAGSGGPTSVSAASEYQLASVNVQGLIPEVSESRCMRYAEENDVIFDGVGLNLTTISCGFEYHSSKVFGSGSQAITIATDKSNNINIDGTELIAGCCCGQYKCREKGSASGISGFISTGGVSCGNNLDLNYPAVPAVVLVEDDASSSSYSSLELRLGL